jgi:hypothetical protein
MYLFSEKIKTQLSLAATYGGENNENAKKDYICSSIVAAGIQQWLGRRKGKARTLRAPVCTGVQPVPG